MAYIEIKHTIWKRYDIEEKDFEKFMQLDEREKYDSVLSLIDTDGEWLYETEEVLTPQENLNLPTVEVFGKKYEASWDNTPLDVKREKKIQSILK